MKIFIWFALVYSIFANGQSVRNITVNDGLPQSFVTNLGQDSQGFVWITNINSISRYDGFEWKVYRHRESDSLTLASNFIQSTKIDKKDNLWILYYTNEIDFRTPDGKIEHVVTQNDLATGRLKKNIQNWTGTTDGTIWYSSNNDIKSFDRKKNNKVWIHVDARDSVRSIIEDRKKQIWVLTDFSLKRINQKTRKIKTYQIPEKLFFKSVREQGNDAPRFQESKNGLLIFTDDRSVIVFDPNIGSFKKFLFPSMQNVTSSNLNTANFEYLIYRRGCLWGYSQIYGLQVIIKTEDYNFDSIYCYMVDKSGLIWFGTTREGIYQIDRSVKFKSYKSNADFAEEIFRRDFNLSLNDVFNWSKTHNGTLPASYYLRTLDLKGELYLALNRRVCQYNKTTRKILKLPLLPTDKYSGFNPIRGISIMENGNLVVVDEKCTIYFYDAIQNQWIANGTALKKLKSTNTIIQDMITVHDTAWISTEASGLIAVDLKRNRNGKQIFLGNSRNNLKSDKLLGIIQDNKNKDLLWVASYEGLISYNKNNGTIKKFSAKQGLPDNVIYSLLQDNIGNLWLGTNSGLCKFDPLSNKQKTFTIADNLPSNEFNRFHNLMLPSGEMAFGGVNGYVVFNPLTIINDNYNPAVALTSFKINNVNINDDLNNRLNTIRAINLPYHENTIAIRFAALQFNQPTNIRYRYYLEGYDKTWIYAGNNREAIYTKVAPGSYTFKVNSSNTSGRWSSHYKTLKIKILPPWWQTWWAYSLYFLLFIMALFLIFNYRLKQLLLKKEIVIKQRESAQLREMDVVKSRFFSNITHELRTPLTLILAPAEQINFAKDSEETSTLVSIIKKNANDLLSLTNQLLDLARIEAGAFNAIYKRGDIMEVLKVIIGTFRPQAEISNVEINLKGPEKAEYSFSHEMLERIIYNLLSNALKFSKPETSIDIKLEQIEKGIEITVMDSGIGINEKDLPKIFDRYFKGEYSTKGTGIGLSIVKEFIDLQNGEITVCNRTDKSGAIFKISLPYEAEITSNYKAADNEIDEIQLEKNSKPLILIVEDDHGLMNFIARSLSGTYSLLYANNGNEGVSIAIETMPDLIISDVVMMDLGGFELCKTLKENIQTSHIPIILLTGKSDTESKIEGLSIGADDYITKPFNVQELTLRIANRLDQVKRQQLYISNKIQSFPTREDIADNFVDHPFITKVHEIIEQYYQNENFTVENLAEKLSMSRGNLHRKLKAIAQMNSSEIIKAYRLKKAVLLMRQDLNIAEIAYNTGFGSPSYFSKCFKDFYKITPSEYLQNF